MASTRLASWRGGSIDEAIRDPHGGVQHPAEVAAQIDHQRAHPLGLQHGDRAVELDRSFQAERVDGEVGEAPIRIDDRGMADRGIDQVRRHEASNLVLVG